MANMLQALLAFANKKRIASNIHQVNFEIKLFLRLITENTNLKEKENYVCVLFKRTESKSELSVFIYKAKLNNLNKSWTMKRLTFS